MKSPSWRIHKDWFLGFEGWKEPRGPYYVIPTIVIVPMEDLNINIRGTSLSFLWFNIGFQIHIKKWDRMLDDRKYEIEDNDMLIILDELQSRYGWKDEPDAAVIRKIVSKTPWLRQILANSGVGNSYAIKVISDLMKKAA